MTDVHAGMSGPCCQICNGLDGCGLPKARKDATAVIFRTGSGGRLTSRRCREITLAVLLISQFSQHSIYDLGCDCEPFVMKKGPAAFTEDL